MGTQWRTDCTFYRPSIEQVGLLNSFLTGAWLQLTIIVQPTRDKGRGTFEVLCIMEGQTYISGIGAKGMLTWPAVGSVSC